MILTQKTLPVQNIYILQGGHIAESLLTKKFGDIFTFRDMGTEINILFKNEKRVGVQNDVMCRTIFQFYKVFYNMFK